MYNINNSDLLDPIIKNSLEYYDSFQPNIAKIINNIKYIEFIKSDIVADRIAFYDKDKKYFFESAYEVLSVYLAKTETWKWSWSLPMTIKKQSFITRKILEYAFNLDSEQDFLLKSTLINSKIKIKNNIQLDIHIALAANLCRKPFILKLFLPPPNQKNIPTTDNLSTDDNLSTNENTSTMYSSSSTDNEVLPELYPYLHNDDEHDNLLVMYIFILDYN